MFSRFTIQTRLSSVEAEEVLRKLVQPRRGFLEPDPASPDIRPFVGAVDRGSFNFHRMITGRNSFLPMIRGRVVQAEGGAVVLGHMRLAVSVAIFMLFWMGATTTAAIHEVPKSLREHDLLAAFGAAFFPLFGAALVGIGYYPERHKALRLLRDAFLAEA